MKMTSDGILIILGIYKKKSNNNKTIRSNIDSVYTGLKRLPSESQLNADELIKLDTILNDSISVI